MNWTATAIVSHVTHFLDAEPFCLTVSLKHCPLVQSPGRPGLEKGWMSSPSQLPLDTCCQGLQDLDKNLEASVPGSLGPTEWSYLQAVRYSTALRAAMHSSSSSASVGHVRGMLCCSSRGLQAAVAAGEVEVVHMLDSTFI